MLGYLDIPGHCVGSLCLKIFKNKSIAFVQQNSLLTWGRTNSVRGGKWPPEWWQQVVQHGHPVHCLEASIELWSYFEPASNEVHEILLREGTCYLRFFFFFWLASASKDERMSVVWMTIFLLDACLAWCRARTLNRRCEITFQGLWNLAYGNFLITLHTV